MVRVMDGNSEMKFSGGVNQSGVRDHNERLILTVLQRHGPTAGADLARLTGLSPQTISIILRKLENDEILKRGEPMRGRVGKPSIPMKLNEDGVFSIGMKIEWWIIWKSEGLFKFLKVNRISVSKCSA